MKNAPLAVRWRLGNPEDVVYLEKIMETSGRVPGGFICSGRSISWIESRVRARET